MDFSEELNKFMHLRSMELSKVESVIVKFLDKGRAKLPKPSMDRLRTVNNNGTHAFTSMKTGHYEMLTTKDNLHEFSIVTSPITTAIYEQQLDDILNNKLTPEAFMKSLKDNINKLIEVAKKAYNNVTPERPKAEATGNKCPECNSDMVMKSGKFGDFEACSNYPACKHIAKKEKLEFAPAAAGTPDYGVKCTGEICPECKSAIIERDGKFGRFKTCSNYPKCKWTPPKPERPKPEATDKLCSKCGKPMLKRNSKDGTKQFLACSGYPDCKNIDGINEN